MKYESHRDFLSQCLTEKLVSKGLKLEIEPILGNHGQELIENWFMKLNKASLILLL